MKKILILSILCLCLVVGCSDDKEILTEIPNEVDISEVSVEPTSEREDVFKYIETMAVVSNFEVDEKKVSDAVSKGFESPFTELDLYHYSPNADDTIQYTSQKSSFELGESLRHEGFGSLEIVYERTQYIWDDFFDELDVTEITHDVSVSLKGSSIYESDVVDDYEKYYRYFDESIGIYYEVTDLMMGNFSDPNSELTNQITGMSCNYQAINGLVPPSYNPFLLENDEHSIQYFITSHEDKPCVFMTSIYNGKLYKRWIDIEYGILVKELVFDSDGLIVDKKVLLSLEEKDIESAVFAEPDIDYKDITLYIFVADGGDVTTLSDAMYHHFPDGDFGVRLTSAENQLTFYSTGLSQSTPSVDDVVYVSYHTNDAGETSRIRRIQDSRIYTIHDGLKMMEIYDKSCYEKKFFNFSDVGLLSVVKTENGMNYTFYDSNNISVSSLYDVYEYVIENGVIQMINTYQIESINDNTPIRDVTSYTYEFIEFDESAYDESCLDTYKIIDRGEGSINDGESRPFWYD